MSSLRLQDRKSLCQFTFSDGRQCCSPRFNDPRFCPDHSRKVSQSEAAEELANDLAFFFSAEYLSACDLAAALGRLFPAVVRGDIKPRTARTLTYLAQTLVQTIHLAQNEYINACGPLAWRDTLRKSIDQNSQHDTAPALPPPIEHPNQVPSEQPTCNLDPIIPHHPNESPHALNSRISS